MDCGAGVVFGTAEQEKHYACFRDAVAEVHDRLSRAQSCGELIDVLLHLVDARLAVLRLIRLEIVRQQKAGALVFAQAAAYALGR